MRQNQKAQGGFVLVATLLVLMLITLLGLSMIYVSKESISALDRVNRRALAVDASSSCTQAMFLEISEKYNQTEPLFPCESREKWWKICEDLGSSGIISNSLRVHLDEDDTAVSALLRKASYECSATYMPVNPGNLDETKILGSDECPGNSGGNVRCINYLINVDAYIEGNLMTRSESLIQFEIDMTK